MKRCEKCKDKAFGIMMLRHSVITEKQRKALTIKQKGKFAKVCLHTCKRNELYRLEKNEDLDKEEDLILD